MLKFLKLFAGIAVGFIAVTFVILPLIQKIS